MLSIVCLFFFLMLPSLFTFFPCPSLQCDRTTALTALHTELLQPPTKIGILGSGCSVATEPTAEVSRYYNITHVSYTCNMGRVVTLQLLHTPPPLQTTHLVVDWSNKNRCHYYVLIISTVFPKNNYSLSNSELENIH